VNLSSSLAISIPAGLQMAASGLQWLQNTLMNKTIYQAPAYAFEQATESIKEKPNL